MPVSIAVSEVQPGDVLLGSGAGKLSTLIQQKTKSTYSHAGLVLVDLSVAEATGKGVGTVSLEQFKNRYPYVAVMRPHHGSWSTPRLLLAKQYVEELMRRGVGYNVAGIVAFSRVAAEHQANLLAAVRAYFEDGIEPPDPVDGSLFCSQLVVNCFYKAGIYDKSLTLLYDGSAMAPGDLAGDATFGLFQGYLVRNGVDAIPKADRFYYETALATE